MPHPIDYAVYQHHYNQSNEFMNHLKEIGCQVLVKPYCLRFEHTAKLIEEIIATRTLSLDKQGENYRCIIDGTYSGQSLYPSMAVCLALLDVYGEKEIYEEEAKALVAKQIQEVNERSAELERRLQQDKWGENK